MESEVVYISRLSAPLQLELRITALCNLACKYCYAAPFTGERIDFNDYKRIIDESEQLGIFEIYLAGGEPLLHPHFARMLEYVVSKPFTVYILTNGTMITKKMASLIKNLTRKYNKNINVHVSLDSYELGINDVVRGSTQSVKNGIENLLDVGLMPALGCVVTSANLHSVPSLITQYFPRIKEFNVMPLIPTRQVVLHLNDLIQKDYWEEVKALRRTLVKMKNELPEISLSIMEDQTAFPKKEEIWQGMCNAGELKLIVKANLDVITCNIAPSFVIGNLSHSTIKEVWDSFTLNKSNSASLSPPCTEEFEKFSYNSGKSIVRKDQIETIGVRSKSVSPCIGEIYDQ
jgi:MoaA/NifB/PqqE/SkfB family radical SAM enzyme